jgi:hypothetical protein
MNARQKIHAIELKKLKARHKMFIGAKKTEQQIFWWAKTQRSLIKVRALCLDLLNLPERKHTNGEKNDKLYKTNIERAHEVLHIVNEYEVKLESYHDEFKKVKVYYGLSDEEKMDFCKRYNIKKDKEDYKFNHKDLKPVKVNRFGEMV